MKAFKRIVYVLFLVVMLAMLTGCSGKSPSNSKDRSEKVSKDKDRDKDRDKDDEDDEEKGVLIASALETDAAQPQRSIKSFQDIAAFFSMRIDTWNETYRKVSVEDVESTAVAEYVRLLIDEFDYEIVGSTNFDLEAEDAFNGNFEKGSWEVLLALRGIDTGRETKGSIDTSTPCDIRLNSAGKGAFTMVFTDLFYTKDYGYRYSGSEGDRFCEVYGQRVWDEYYLKNGRYCNGSDGVLSVEAGTHGEAIILINGEEVLYSIDAGVGNEMYVDYARDDYKIGIYDFMDGVEGESIQLTVPKTLTGGEVYTLSDGLAVRGDSPIWLIYAPGTGESEGKNVSSSVTPNARAAMNACTVRILKWDDVECVVYISMDIVTELEPMMIEVLAAMPAYGSLWGETFKKEEAISLKVGDSVELKYDGPYVFMPNYQTYEWNITSGQGVSISGYNDTCTVTGVTAGQIIIKCVYSYGKDEPDVLTGIPRNENHTKTKLYYIEVVD